MGYINEEDVDFKYIDKILEFLAHKNNSTKERELKNILFSNFQNSNEKEVRAIVTKCYLGIEL